jgi:hypothetical protein
MLGYALAHFAWFHDEDRAAWAKHLRWAPVPCSNRDFDTCGRRPMLPSSPSEIAHLLRTMNEAAS